MECTRFPYYSGNIYESEAKGYVDYERFVSAHQWPSDKTMKLLNEINKASIAGDKKLKNELKRGLFTFTPSVMIGIGAQRQYTNIDRFTQFMQLDFDGIETEEEAIRLKEYVFNTYPQILCAYLSPSRLGVKCLLRIKTPVSIKHYKAIYKTVQEEFEATDHFDTATKNAILPLFLSADREILHREFNQAEVWFKEDWTQPKYVRLVDIPTHSKSEVDVYYNKVVSIIETRISSITDNGHPQVRDTALVLGSRVGAGYISQSEAEQLIEGLICRNSYLQKGIAGYIKTSLWGIQNGIPKPKYF